MTGKVSPEVEAVVRRGLSPDREDRYRDVEEYVAALEAAMGDPGASGESAQAWIPADPDLTQAAPRPEATRPVGDLPPVPSPRARRRWPWAVAGVLALVAGVLGGWALERALTTERVLHDAEGQISVTVPEEWARHVALDPWTPEDSEGELPSLSAGTTADWNSTEDPAPGVFVGVLPGDELPTSVPGHPECEVERSQVSDVERSTLTGRFLDCGDVGVTMERVIRANADQLVWVQVRSDDQPTAIRVLESVELTGM